MPEKICAHDPCGRTFVAKRRDARYCSPSCRADASRARRTAEKQNRADSEQLVPAKDCGSAAAVSAEAQRQESTRQLSFAGADLPAPEPERRPTANTSRTPLAERVPDVRTLVEAAKTELRAELHAATLQFREEQRRAVQQFARDMQRAKAERGAIARRVRDVTDRADAVARELRSARPRRDPRIDDLRPKVTLLSRQVHALAQRLDAIDQATADALNALAGLAR